MDFLSIVEYAKNGSTMPKTSSQSEQLAYTTITGILENWKLGLVTNHRALEEKKRAERLFEEAKLEEKRRREMLRTYQQNTLKVEEILHEINKELSKQEADKDKIIDLSLCALEVLTNTKLNRLR